MNSVSRHLVRRLGAVVFLGVGASLTLQSCSEQSSLASSGNCQIPDSVLPAISGFSPVYGWPGSTVIITGRGFVRAAKSHLVVIGGKSATLVSILDTQIVATVPEGAQSGSPIGVTICGDAARSTQLFTVTGKPRFSTCNIAMGNFRCAMLHKTVDNNCAESEPLTDTVLFGFASNNCFPLEYSSNPEIMDSIVFRAYSNRSYGDQYGQGSDMCSVNYTLKIDTVARTIRDAFVTTMASGWSQSAQGNIGGGGSTEHSTAVHATMVPLTTAADGSWSGLIKGPQSLSALQSASYFDFICETSMSGAPHGSYLQCLSAIAATDSSYIAIYLKP